MGEIMNSPKGVKSGKKEHFLPHMGHRHDLINTQVCVNQNDGHCEHLLK